MKFLNKIANSYLFVAFCAVALSVETFLITGVALKFTIPALLFFSTLFVYNMSKLRLILYQPQAQSDRMRVTLTGHKLRVLTTAFCIPIIILLLAACTPAQVLLFMLIAMGSLIYMMPFSVNGNEWKGLRNLLFTKNIVLSLIWTIATVAIPLAGDSYALFADEATFIFLRHYFFIYALTVVFDIRDLSFDKKCGFKTLASVLGEQKARHFAMISILVFVLLTIFDQNLSNPVTVALLLSAFFAAVVIYFSEKKSPHTYYTFLVDGSMVFQFMLVLFASLIW